MAISVRRDEPGSVEAPDRLDVDKVTSCIKEIAGDHPIWHLRRAACLAWLGDEEKARHLISATWSNLLGRCHRPPFSIALQSRLAWSQEATIVPRQRSGPIFTRSAMSAPRGSAIPAATPWCRSRDLRPGTRSTVTWRISALNVRRMSCGARGSNFNADLQSRPSRCNRGAKPRSYDGPGSRVSGRPFRGA